MSQEFPPGVMLSVGKHRHSSCVTPTQQAQAARASLAQGNGSLSEPSYLSLKTNHEAYFTEG